MLVAIKADDCFSWYHHWYYCCQLKETFIFEILFFTFNGMTQVTMMFILFNFDLFSCFLSPFFLLFINVSVRSWHKVLFLFFSYFQSKSNKTTTTTTKKSGKSEWFATVQPLNNLLAGWQWLHFKSSKPLHFPRRLDTGQYSTEYTEIQTETATIADMLYVMILPKILTRTWISFLTKRGGAQVVFFFLSCAFYYYGLHVLQSFSIFYFIFFMFCSSSYPNMQPINQSYIWCQAFVELLLHIIA